MFGRQASLKVSRRYVECVNARDLRGLGEVLAERCRLIDASGDWMEGREVCLEAFTRFFEIEPNYRLHTASMSRSGENVLIRGRSEADDPRFKISTLFRARCDERELHEWQSYSAVQGAAICRMLAGSNANKGPVPEAIY